MATTEPTVDNPVASEGEPVDPELCWLNLADLAPHPDNPRGSLGDLTELVRSIRSHGILEPLVVLPADDDGVYWIVAGHRRYAAGIKAGVTDVPAVVRQMSPVEVIEAMLSENVNRSDLTVAEEVRAIERLMSLDEGLTPAKLCRRIGRSQAWVRARMAVTILPAKWRAALDGGELTLAAGEAAATLADLGPEQLDAVCGLLAGRSWGDPARTVAGYRDDLRRREAYDQAVAKARAKHPVVFTSDEPSPSNAKRVGELFDPDNCKAHAAEACHAVVVQRTGWGQGYDSWEVCTDPRRHAPHRVGTGKGSELASDYTRPRSGGGDDSHAKRKGRLARLAHATETFARQRGGISQADLTRLALRGLVFEAGREAIAHAATILGYDQPRDVSESQLLDGVETPATLARVAGAVAAGLAETRMYWSATSPQCRDFLDLLIGSGWAPDDWTAAVLANDGAGVAPGAEQAGDDHGDDSDQGPGDGWSDERDHDNPTQTGTAVPHQRQRPTRAVHASTGKAHGDDARPQPEQRARTPRTDARDGTAARNGGSAARLPIHHHAQCATNGPTTTTPATPVSRTRTRSPAAPRPGEYAAAPAATSAADAHVNGSRRRWAASTEARGRFDHLAGGEALSVSHVICRVIDNAPKHPEPARQRVGLPVRQTAGDVTSTVHGCGGPNRAFAIPISRDGSLATTHCKWTRWLDYSRWLSRYGLCDSRGSSPATSRKCRNVQARWRTRSFEGRSQG
jgi:ParB/RepB/Spo0J family partition protein